MAPLDILGNAIMLLDSFADVGERVNLRIAQRRPQ